LDEIEQLKQQLEKQPYF